MDGTLRPRRWIILGLLLRSGLIIPTPLDFPPNPPTSLSFIQLTPCLTVEEAEKMELGKLFLEANSNRKMYL